MSLLFFFTHTPPPEIYPLSLHDALPISSAAKPGVCNRSRVEVDASREWHDEYTRRTYPHPIRVNSSCHSRRSEEHTSELQSRPHLVCRLLLEKKKKKK